tara:strand:- start:219 stop:443 length:225 start_codon:yes stop_codon:yes gene_type:complete
VENDYLYNCRGCKKPDKDNIRVKPITYHKWARCDAYGIYTGMYCDKCYSGSKYPYKKNRYHDPSYAGERLYPED